MTTRSIAAAWLAALIIASGASAWAADLLAPDAADAVTVAGPAHAPVALGIDALKKLPATQLSISFLAERGMRHASFEGPLLWTVLEKTGVIDPAKHRDQVAQFVVITGRDGYRAVLALAEIAPDFEGKSAILADRMDGKPFAAQHLRIAVPLDKRGGRSVRDVVRIDVLAAPPRQQ